MGKFRKIAIPLKNYQICGKFESATTYLIFTIFQDIILKEKSVSVANLEVDNRVLKLKENRVSEVLTKEADLETLEFLNKMKINVFIGVNGIDPYQVIKEYMQGTLLNT